MSERLHNPLKQWLVELGEQTKDSRGNPRYEAYSGDSQPIDIRYGKKHVEYKPDVVWNHRGQLHIIELAFSENWRSIVGEIALASMVKHCKLFLVTQGFPHEFVLDNLVPMFAKKFDLWYTVYNYEDEIDDLDSVEKDIRKHLKDLRWI
jgi:hypothetical protein